MVVSVRPHRETPTIRTNIGGHAFQRHHRHRAGIAATTSVVRQPGPNFADPADDTVDITLNVVGTGSTRPSGSRR